MQYNPQKIERKWQKKWSSGHPKPKGNKGKDYVLDMFPYPSGDGLHVGHVENFTATDIYARFMRFQGYEVLHPMGWDAFGLPAENFAIKTGIHPDKRTRQSIKNFTHQIKSIGLSYDWNREINTSSPDYYKWTQWMFLLLYKNGLAYKKKAKVNWCNSCQTVLANEQVIDGKCDRSGDVVVQKDLEQWFFKITDFVEDTRTKEGKKVKGLLSGLEKLDWPASTKLAQQNWIGRSEGAEAVFAVSNTEEEIRVFTTRLDTIYGCTYVVLAPEHSLIKDQEFRIRNVDEVREYLLATKKKTDLERTELNKEKTGVCLEGIEAIHPFTGKRLPVYIADYVLGTYGTGAVMGVPAHDERDAEFAKKYGLDISQVILPDREITGVGALIRLRNGKLLFQVRDGKTTRDPGMITAFGGGSHKEESHRRTLLRELKEELGVEVQTEKFFEIGIFNSWNNPGQWIQMYIVDGLDEQNIFVAEGAGSIVLNMEEALQHPKVTSFTKHVLEQSLHPISEETFTGDGRLTHSGSFTGLLSAEAREKMVVWLKKEGLGGKKVNRDWLISRQRYWGAPIPIIYCENCGTVSVSEKDLPVKLPTDVDFRPTGESPLVRSKSFHKVKCPKCGVKARLESDTMDTFVCSSWYYLRFADPQNQKSFASRKNLKKFLPVDFYMGGAEHTVLHLLYARFFTKMLAKCGYVQFDEPFTKLRHQGIILGEDGNKMSKSKGNVVNPDHVIEEFGADSLRLYEMFMGSLEEMKPWKTSSIIGLRRFLERVWKMGERLEHQVIAIENENMESLLHKTIKKVTEDIQTFKFNTAISSLMICLNRLEKEKYISKSNFAYFLVLLSPFAPHIAEELWERIGGKQSIFSQTWPKWDKQKIVDETVTIVVQINGKVRDRLLMSAETSEKDAQILALSSPLIKKYLAGQAPKKIVFVPGRLLNIVIGERQSH